MISIQRFMKALRENRKLVIAFTILVAVGLGYLSSYYSMGACEKDAAGRLAKGFEGSDRIYCIEWPSSVDAKVLFGGATTVVTTLEPGMQPGSAVPRLGVERAQVRSPFLVSVSWYWLRAKNRGATGTYRYFSLFGAAFRIGSHEAAI